MKQDLWTRIDEVFQAVVELDPRDRVRFLDVECKDDPELRAQLDSLLSVDSLEWDLFDRPALESAAAFLYEDPVFFENGQRVGRYTIEKLIGRGGMGEVYLARDESLDRRVALKFLPLDHSNNSLRIERFRLEAQAVSSLNHPNILTIHEFDEFDGRTFLVTELIEGETLRQTLSHRRLPLTEVLEIGIQLAEALAAAHHNGIVHRDIKPENIMIRPDGYIKVLDFGLAKFRDSLEIDKPSDIVEPNASSSFFRMGTPSYMSPEQISGERIDHRTDIFSLGAVLYEMITGRALFDAFDRVELSMPMASTDSSNAAPSTPKPVLEMIDRMLENDRDRRYQDVTSVIEVLSGAKRDLSNLRTRKKHAAAAPALAIALLLVICSALVWLFYPVNSSSANHKINARLTFKAPLNAPRQDAEAAVLNDVLYVAGGMNACTPVGYLEAFDAELDRWNLRAPMNTPRGYHGIASTGRELFVIGGKTGCDSTIDSVESYDPQTDSWSYRSRLPTARSNHMVAAIDGKLWSIGGQSSTGDYIDDVDQYDPEKDVWTKTTPLTSPRGGSGVIAVDKRIFVLGGSDRSRSLSTVEVFDPETSSWTVRSPMPAARSNFATAEVDGIIYLFGGAGKNSEKIEAYDIRKDQWIEVAQLPASRVSAGAAILNGTIYVTGGNDKLSYLSSVMAFATSADRRATAKNCPHLHSQTKAAMSRERHGAFAAAIEGKAYVIGGYSPKSGYLDLSESYDPIYDNWTKKAPMPTARSGASSNGSIVVNGRLFVIGGNANGKCTNANEMYDPKTDKWTVKKPMPTPRCHVATVAHNELIYTIGGTNTSGSERYAIMEIYDPAADEWTIGVPMPTGRHSAAAVSLNGLIFVMGGVNLSVKSGELSVVEAYDPASKVWSRVAPLNMERTDFAASITNGQIFVSGGYGQGSRISSSEVYDPSRNMWTVLADETIARGYAASVSIDDTIYIFGGDVDGDTRSLSDTKSLTLQQCADR